MSKIRASGGYRKLASFQTTTIIYDTTVWFCDKFLDSRSRTVDQMVQAARSGRQNIAEGSRAAAASSQSELFLTNVARASLEELLLDYEDFLRHRHLPQWESGSPEASAVRGVPRRYKQDQSDQSNSTNQTDLSDHQRWALYSRWLDSDDAAIRANATICLIHQANYLLDKQITAIEQQFIQGGGYKENLAAARLAERARKKDPSNSSDQTNPTDQIPNCSQCGKPMALRTAKQGKHPGSQFWGCTGYPDCKGTAPV